MHIKIGNKVIHEPIVNILYQVKRELTNGKLKDIDARNNSNIRITCPCHKDGFESRPSCRVLVETDVPDLEAGYAYCFACGYYGCFTKLIGDLFDKDQAFGEEWLLDRFGDVFVTQDIILDPIVINNPPIKKSITYMNEEELLKYDFYHSYMWQRKLSREIVDRFRVGYDHDRDAITFPVYDEKHGLVMVTARSVRSKYFWIPSTTEKPIYLLYDVLDRKFDTVLITEAQLDALTAYSWGYPTIATMGVPSEHQIQLLNSCGIHQFITVFDNDESGRKFTQRLKTKLRKDIFVDTFNWSGINYKDINNFTKEEFDSAMQEQGFAYAKIN